MTAALILATTLLSLTIPAFAPIAPERPCAARVYQISHAIKTMENVRSDLNNPGGLTVDGKVLKFSTYAEGEVRLLRLVERRARQGHSLRSMMRKWAPDGAGWYGMWLAKEVGVGVDELICGVEEKRR